MKVIIPLLFVNGISIILSFTDRGNRYRVRKYLILTWHIGKNDPMKLESNCLKKCHYYPQGTSDSEPQRQPY